MDKTKVLSIVDHTVLKPESTWEDIKNLIDDAIKYGTYSVCISPCFVEKAKKYANGRVKICTVIGFPNGVNTKSIKMLETNDAISNGATEIDMVANIGDIKCGDFESIEKEIKGISTICHQSRQDNNERIILKVIIETCLLTEDEIRKMCHVVYDGGADFIKTSTGFSTAGATFRDVEIMNDEIKKMGVDLKIKAAGGISSFEDAEKFIELGASRLGTSRLVKIAKENE